MTTMYAFGSNASGQLGTDARDDIHLPRRVILDDDVCAVTGGANLSVALTTTGALLLSGRNASATFAQLSWRVNVCAVSCGWNHVCCVDASGRLWSFGDNKHGQLGVGKQISSASEPTLLSVLSNVGFEVSFKNIACGLRHSIALSTDGSLYAWGSNRFGQCGASHADSSLIIWKPTIIAGWGNSDSVVLLVAAGAYHTAFVTQGNHLYTLGQNKSFQLGYLLCANNNDQAATTQMIQRTPRRVHLLHVCSQIVQLVLGWHHTALLTDMGEVCLFGRNSYGQLGNPEALQGQHVYLKNLFPPSSRVKQLASGSEHLLAIVQSLPPSNVDHTDNREELHDSVWAWGWNEHGNCGIESALQVNDNCPANILQPTMVSIDFTLNTPYLIGCGYGHSFVICKNRFENG